jgi:hypothetical protein
MVTDFKGELAAISRKYRGNFGQVLVRWSSTRIAEAVLGLEELNPFNIMASAEGVDPLGTLHPNSDLDSGINSPRGIRAAASRRKHNGKLSGTAERTIAKNRSNNRECGGADPSAGTGTAARAAHASGLCGF